MNIWAFPSFYPYDHPGMKWLGIFAHRQYKGLIANGANLQVIQPVSWHPAAPFYHLHKDWQQWAVFKYPKERVYDGITVHHPRIANMKPGRIFSKPYAERYADAIISLFKNKRISLDPKKDIFYAQWIPDACFVQLAAQRLGVKFAVLAVGDDVTVWPHKGEKQLSLFRETLIGADARFAVAGYLAREACKLIGKDIPFHIAYRGVDHDVFKPVSEDERAHIKTEFGIPGGKTVILTIGAAIVRKGWLELFDALKKLKRSTSNFILAGVHGGAAELDLQKEAADRGLQDHFINLGEVPPGRINRLYNAADIFCLPSHTEGIANSVAEAMATGIATITTSVGGHPELISNPSTGILIPPKQPEAIYDALMLLVNDANKRHELGANARDFIVHKWGNFEKNAALLYRDLSATLNLT